MMTRPSRCVGAIQRWVYVCESRSTWIEKGQRLVNREPERWQRRSFMDREDRSENNTLLEPSDSWDGSWNTSAVEVQTPLNGQWQIPIWMPGPILDSLPAMESHRSL